MSDDLTGMALLRSKRGRLTQLTRALGLKSSGAISQWKKVPADRLLAVESATGIPREKLRPDLFGSPAGKSAEAA